MSKTAQIDYSLVGVNAKKAVELGLAEADWYTSPVPRDEMRKLLERRDGPAIRDTLLWFGILLVSGIAGLLLWGSWWAVIPFAVYGVIYGTSSDSRWHETSHGTAFKTDWMNNVLYEIASFMVVRESTPWRWSHTRHHSDTIIVGRDPEIAVPRPPSLLDLFLSFATLKSTPQTFIHLFIHASGRMTEEEKTYIPEDAFPDTYRKARIWLAIYAVVIGSCFYFGSILPLMFIGLPSIYGAWLMPVFGLTQHAGLAENVLDHRLNCRTVYMNPVFRYLYWNMNYHLEHHMFPLVPYHNLPRLHHLVKDDHPPPYPNTWAAFREIVPALLRQRKDPGWHVRRELPASHHEPDAAESGRFSADPSAADAEGWIKVCPADALHREDTIRFDCGDRTFAIYKLRDDTFHATDGICTHGNTHLADGFVRGNQIECPKHNGRFDVRDGSPQRAPVCAGLQTYEVRVTGDELQLNLESAGGVGAHEASATHTFRVVSNDNVATYIKELVLEPVIGNGGFTFEPGDYVQLEIPAYELTLDTVDVQEPYASVWRAHHYFECEALNETPTRRNYSLAANPETDRLLRLNVRFAPPPDGMACFAGVGSSYVFSLKPGDTVQAVGPYGDFRIRPTEAEMVYIGGGAGMAPMRSHIAYLFDSLQTGRKVSFWYGARSLQELFYTEYFEDLAARFENFSFHVALSEPQEEDRWDGPTGFIHNVVRSEHLDGHPTLDRTEFYLCGPPAMIEATREMLGELNVDKSQVAFDEF